MTITVAEAAHWLNDGAAAIVIGASADYREAHPEDAVWAIRPRLDRLGRDQKGDLSNERLAHHALVGLEVVDVVASEARFGREGSHPRLGLPVEVCTRGDPGSVCPFHRE